MNLAEMKRTVNKGIKSGEMPTKAMKAAFDGLGKNHKDVAESLELLGIKGVKHSSCNCPLARLAFLIVGRTVSVAPSSLGLLGGFSIDQSYATLPLQCNRFARNFDSGMYPNLVE